MYLVTGATGNVGKELVDQLLSNGKSVRVFTRDPRKVAHWGDRVEIAQGDFEDARSFARAAAGTVGAFLMNGAAEVGSFPRLIEAAQKEKLPRIVFLSSLFASLPGINIGRIHAEKENAIRQAGIPAHFLRAGGFMSNTLQWTSTIKTKGVVYNPMGSGKIAPIAPEDIAAVASKLLLTPDGVEDTLELTGDQLLTVAEEVAILGEAIGKPIRIVEVPVEAAVESMQRNGLPPQLAAAFAESIAVVRDGHAKHLTHTFERITGRQPMSLAQWAKKHAAQFN